MPGLGQSILSFCLRVGELAFAATVAGLTGEYLAANHESDWSQKRFIYTEVIAGLSILLALLWLLPFSGGFIHWPVDLLISVAWFVAFGLLVNFIGPLDCGSVFYWGDITHQGTCQKWKADIAFCFLSAIFWLVSTLLGLWYIHRHRTTGAPVDGVKHHTTTTRRRPWYRSHRY